MTPAAAALLYGLLAGPASAAASCGDTIAHARRLEGRRDTVAFAPTPTPWVLGRHFAVELQVCPRDGAPLPDAVRVDARMPEHGHGMAYRPRLQALGGGRWRAEGLMLHMAGRWELSIELHRGDEVERLVHELRLQ